MATTHETMSQRQALADKLVGLTGKVRASSGEFQKIYGPGVNVITRGRKVKILLTKLNYRNPENANGDIWCRVREPNTGMEMWMPSTFIMVKDDN